MLHGRSERIVPSYNPIDNLAQRRYDRAVEQGIDQMTPLEILIAARAKIAQGWCQNNLAVTSSGFDTNALNPNAVSWCAVGALSHAAGCRSVGAKTNPDFSQTGWQALCQFSAANFLSSYDPDDIGWAVTKWNDNPMRTQADVLAAFDRAISALVLPLH